MLYTTPWFQQFNIQTLMTPGSQQIVMIAVIIFCFLRILSILFVTRDILARTNNLGLQITSILLVIVLTPLIGLPLYFVIRPLTFKKLENGRRQALMLETVKCYNCGRLNEKNYDYCIFCGEHLKIACKECGKDYPYYYEYCNSCGAPNIEI